MCVLQEIIKNSESVWAFLTIAFSIMDSENP